MKITYMSDLHLEHHRDGGSSFFKELVAGDILVLAGDICTISMMENVLASFCALYKRVVYVCGNHEYYGSSKEAVQKKLEEISTQLPNLYYLNRSSVVIGGQRFIGATLWFPDQPMNFTKHGMLSDFRYIESYADWVYKENYADQEYLDNNVQEGDIVVTHHLPCSLSVASAYKNSPLNCFYVSPMEDTIMDNKPAVWLHGHTHSNVDYVLGDTRVLCNPMGYGAENSSFEIEASFTKENT